MEPAPGGREREQLAGRREKMGGSVPALRACRHAMERLAPRALSCRAVHVPARTLAAPGEVLGCSARPASLGILAVLMLVYFYPMAVGREFGPIWADHLGQARETCRTPGAKPEEIVPVAPTD